MRLLLKLTWVEVKLFAREPLALIFAFAFPFFVLIVLAGVFGNEVDAEEPEVWRGVGPTTYYVPAYVGLVMASIGLISLPLHLAGYRERGVLRRFRASGVPAWVVLSSQAIVSVGMAIIGAVSVTVLALTAYGTEGPEDVAGVLAAFVLSIAAFAAIGLALGALLPTARAAQGAGLLLFFVMMFLSGAGPPREVLGAGMKVFSDWLPLTHVILVLQGPWLGLGWDWPAALAVLAMFVAAGAVALSTFRWD